MPLEVYNTLGRRKQRFIPINPPKISMYVCGITPYDETHLGHGRAYVAFDVIRRYLEYLGYEVNYIQNITDIDDKIIKRAQKEGVSWQEIAEKYTQEYFKVTDALEIKRATRYPKATENIEEMIKLIKELIDKGYAYVIDGSVYFEVSKFKDYGKLSKRKTKDMLAGARVEIDERKRDPLDFALWKKAKEGEPFWESPWGKGRPGWHIECSTMSLKYLGQPIDIHGGGLDLVFPHHENEIAQAEAREGKPFVKYWIHNGFVTVNKEKMSKSLGNFFTLREIFEKFSPEVVRFFLLSTHYRSPINFSDIQLKDADEALKKLYDTINLLEEVIQRGEGREVSKALEDELSLFHKKFNSAMDDDFNTAAAIGILFEIGHFTNRIIDKGITNAKFLSQTKSLILDLGNILGILWKKKEVETLSSEIEKLIKERDEARAKKDFEKADLIRNKLLERGIILEDTPFGVRWKRR